MKLVREEFLSQKKVDFLQTKLTVYAIELTKGTSGMAMLEVFFASTRENRLAGAEQRIKQQVCCYQLVQEIEGCKRRPARSSLYCGNYTTSFLE